MKFEVECVACGAEYEYDTCSVDSNPWYCSDSCAWRDKYDCDEFEEDIEKWQEEDE